MPLVGKPTAVLEVREFATMIQALSTKVSDSSLERMPKCMVAVGLAMEDKKTIQSPAHVTEIEAGQRIAVSLLTGGADRPYAFGLGTALKNRVSVLDIIGCDELDCPEFREKPGLHFLNLRGSVDPNVSSLKKVSRVLLYYAKLLSYAWSAKPTIFHILWNNKIEFFDRTLLMLFYRWKGKKTVLTVHNVNAATRDGRDSRLNRLTLRIQYLLADHIFVHTEKMRQDLIADFGVNALNVTVIPFGINNAVPNTVLTSADARKKLGIGVGERTLLFFGNIAPYKGLEYLVEAFQTLRSHGEEYRLIIAGRPKNCEQYWEAIRNSAMADIASGRIILNASFIPDEDTEVYFKAADVLVLPYRYIYQSGVLFLGHSFGLPVLAADVGSLRDDIVEGKTGFIFKTEDPVDLGRVIERYFASGLFLDLAHLRDEIRSDAEEQHSWDLVGNITMDVYRSLLQIPAPTKSLDRNVSRASFDAESTL